MIYAHWYGQDLERVVRCTLVNLLGDRPAASGRLGQLEVQGDFHSSNMHTGESEIGRLQIESADEALTMAE